MALPISGNKKSHLRNGLIQEMPLPKWRLSNIHVFGVPYVMFFFNCIIILLISELGSGVYHDNSTFVSHMPSFPPSFFSESYIWFT
jgi:hypothetical protein